MDGVLVVDKPQGPTSHDVVAAARRLLGERRIGHTGTLDPLATGVLPLAIGRATRLVRFLAASDKEYDATIRFGVTTDSYDITGVETSRTDALPSREAVARALGALTGQYQQVPPVYSAKKIGGRRAYDLARLARRDGPRSGPSSQHWLSGRFATRPGVGGDEQTVALPAAPVRVERVALLEFDAGRARVAVTCSAGFYVRSFAHALGELVGTGACLEALRRTRAGEFGLQAAIRLEELHEAARVDACFVPLHALLSGWPAVTLTDRGRQRAAHGRELEPDDYTAASPRRDPPTTASEAWVRLLDERGALVALAAPGRRAGSLHPTVVLI